MTDESNDTKGHTAEPVEQTEEASFSDAQQAKLNEIISKRLAERDAKHQKEMDDLNRKHQRELEVSKLDEESRLKAEAEDATKALLKRAEDAEHLLRISKAEAELARVGLDTSLAETLIGADDNATKVNIDAVVKASKALADKMYAERVGSPGAPRAPVDGGDADLASIRASMGLK